MAYVKYFLSENKPKIAPKILNALIKQFLLEDIGKQDITTALCIKKNKKIRVKIIAKENFIVCGVLIAKQVFKSIDPGLKFKPLLKEGAYVKNKQTIAIISGPARSILTAERVSLNLLALLSGIATKTHKFVSKIHPFKTKITDTRKTLPGLRLLQKYAVRIGGGYNHRMRLDEMILIKDNHIQAAYKCISLLKIPEGEKIEIEAQNLGEFKKALQLKPAIIMLDNMKISDIKKAIAIPHPGTKLEVSGGINLKNIRKYAATGVDIISVGELTDSVASVDICLDTHSLCKDLN
ncbi:MAG: carboxylating nicotinate-nucleotide diphosphorylase [Candidatus Omnitrophica bacterium]|nr:carboxylating nicotinate-nucleotide diphosphorylase [Candidatus Omnitrophota bacterium]